MKNILSISETKKINYTDYYSSNTIIKDVNKFNIELNASTSNMIGICLNNNICFSINKNLLIVSLLEKGNLFTKRIELKDSILLKTEFDNRIFNFYFKYNENDEWEQLDFTYKDYSEEYTYGIYGIKNSEYISLKLNLSKPDNFNSNDLFYITKDTIEIENSITYNYINSDGLNYLLCFNIDKDVNINNILYKAGKNKNIYLGSEDTDIIFSTIDNNPVKISNIQLKLIEEDNYPQISLPLTETNFEAPIGIGFETIINKKSEDDFTLELLKIKDYEQDIMQILLDKDHSDEGKTYYAEENAEYPQYDGNISEEEGAPETVYYKSDLTSLIINFLDYNKKFRTKTIDLSDIEEIGPSDRYSKWFIDILNNKLSINIKTYEYLYTDGFIKEDNKWIKEISAVEYNKYKTYNDFRVLINNKIYLLKVSNIDGYKLECDDAIPNGIAIIISTENIIKREIEEKIILNSDMSIDILDLSSAANNNIDSINIDNLFLLNVEDESRIWNGNDNIIEKASIYIKFTENNLYCKTVCFNDLNTLLPINIYYNSDLKEYRYKQIFSKEKQNTIVNKKQIIIDNDNKIFIDSDIVWLKAEPVDNEPIDYYLLNNYIVFNEKEKKSKRIINIEYIKDKTFCVNCTGNKTFITIANPRPNITIEYSNDIKEEYLVKNIDLNPFHAENNNGFIYISDKNPLKYINFNCNNKTLRTDGLDELFVEIELYGENHSEVNDFNIELVDYAENDYFSCILNNNISNDEIQSAKRILRILSKKNNNPIEEENKKITVRDTKTGITNSFYFNLEGADA